MNQIVYGNCLYSKSIFACPFDELIVPLSVFLELTLDFDVFLEEQAPLSIFLVLYIKISSRAFINIRTNTWQAARSQEVVLGMWNYINNK